MAFKDKTLTCQDCGAEFVWTADEQEFYAQRGFDHAPIRCKACRAAKKKQKSDAPRQMFDVNVTCAKCGKPITQLPFKPSGDRPVYCQDCYRTETSR